MTLLSPARAWQPCSLPEHLRDVRLRLDGVAHHLETAGREDVDALVTELLSLFDHLDGLHADDVLVRPVSGGLSRA